MATPLNGSLLKGFAILKLITPERQEISAATVASELGMNTATAHRFLHTLEAAGALTSYRRGYYGLGQRIEELGRLAAETNPLAAVVQPILDKISRQLNESVMACRLGRYGPTCMSVAISDRPITVNITVGTVLPLHSSAQGKLWLAEMSEEERTSRLEQLPLLPTSRNTISDRKRLDEELELIRKQGYALNRGENEPDIGAVSVPVKAKDGHMLLTLSVFGMFSRFDNTLIERAKTKLFDAAETIRDQCG